MSGRASQRWICFYVSFFISTAPAAVCAAAVEETFKTELGETMRCVFTAGDSAVTAEALELWLKLRYPYESYGFPGLEDQAGAILGKGFFEKASRNLTAQRRIIEKLRTNPPPESVGPLYAAVIGLFEREHDYSKALLNLFEKRDVEEFIRSLDERLGLKPEERDEIRRLAKKAMSGKDAGDLRGLRDQFFNEHIMVDRQGRHFSDDHREFIRRHRVVIDCRCVENC